MNRPVKLLGVASMAVVGAWMPARPATDLAAVRHALATFSEAPLGPQADAALAEITNFADADASTEVVISKDVAPWVSDDHADAHGTLLLGAFIAGNLRSQLDSGIKRSDPYAGLLQVFAVYRAIREKEPKFVVPPIDALLNRHRRGELGAWLASKGDGGSADKTSGAPGSRPESVAGYAPPAGLVPDEATAIRIAVAVWEPIYGKDAIAAEAPYVAKLDADVWTITGSLPKDHSGGVAEARIDRENGTVLYVMHGE